MKHKSSFFYPFRRTSALKTIDNQILLITPFLQLLQIPLFYGILAIKTLFINLIQRFRSFLKHQPLSHKRGINMGLST